MESDVPMFAAPSPGGIEKRKQYSEYTELVLLLNVFWGKKILFGIRNGLESLSHQKRMQFHKKVIPICLTSTKNFVYRR